MSYRDSQMAIEEHARCMVVTEVRIVEDKNLRLVFKASGPSAWLPSLATLETASGTKGVGTRRKEEGGLSRKESGMCPRRPRSRFGLRYYRAIRALPKSNPKAP